MKTKLIILSALLLIGCGTRKTELTKTDVTSKEVTTEKTTEKETTETKVDTNIKEVIETKVDTEKNVVTETKTIKPIDATKKSIYKGFEFENAEINETKTTDLSKEKKVSIQEYNKAVDFAEKSVKMVNKLFKENKELKAKLKDKATQSDKGNFWNWIILILIIIAFSYCFWWSRKIVRDKEKLNL